MEFCTEEGAEVSRFLLVGSTSAYSGKSAAVLGIATYLQQQGFQVGYGKPIGGCMQGDCARDGSDPDVSFIVESLRIQPEHRLPMLLRLDDDTIRTYLQQSEPADFHARFQSYQAKAQSADLTLLEGPGDLYEGELFELSLGQMAEQLEASVLLIVRYDSHLALDAVLAAGQRLGNRLAGVLLNDVPEELEADVREEIAPFLEKRAIAVLGILPTHRTLRSISVAELVHQLKADVLCCSDRLDLLVEEFTIGAMNVNSALKYFRKSEHKAVITGGDRTDIQLAALETSTHCLILTGQIPPTELIRARAEELEVPILTVDLDTLTTVERIERVFGQVRLHEAVKVRCIEDLIARHFDFARLYTALGISPLASLRSA
jgi:BioD-like phosphotransacetylase family protein